MSRRWLRQWQSSSPWGRRCVRKTRRQCRCLAQVSKWVQISGLWKGLTVLPADLRLRDDQLCGIGVVGAGQGVLEHADSTQHMARDLDLVGEVGWVAKDHLGLRLKLHLRLDARHGGLDADCRVALVQHLINAGVQHVGAAVDGRQTGEALGQLAESVQRVDVGGLSVPGHRVAVQADALDGLGRGALGGGVRIVEVQGHGMADEVLGAVLEAELVVDVFHCAVAQVET